MHPRWRPGCATSPIQFRGQFRLLECAADGGILSGAYQCYKKCTPFDAQLTRFYIRVIRVRDVKWSAWQQLNYLRWISQSVSPLIILSLAGRSDQKNNVNKLFTHVQVRKTFLFTPRPVMLHEPLSNQAVFVCLFVFFFYISCQVFFVTTLIVFLL